MKIDSVSNNVSLNLVERVKDPKENNGKGQDKKNNPVPVDTGPVSPTPVNPQPVSPEPANPPPPVNPLPINPVDVNPVPVNPPPVNPLPVNPVDDNPVPVSPTPVNPLPSDSSPSNQVPADSQTKYVTYNQNGNRVENQKTTEDISTRVVKKDTENPLLRSARNKLQSQPANSGSNSANAMQMHALKLKSFVNSYMVNTGDQNISKVVNETKEQGITSTAPVNQPKPEFKISSKEQVQLQPDVKTVSQDADIGKTSPLNNANGVKLYPRIDVLA